MPTKAPFRLFPKEQGYFPVFWLIYLLFPIYFLTYEPLGKEIIGYLLLGVFVICYRQSYWTKKYLFQYVLVLTLILVVYCLFYHPNYLYLGFFIMYFVSMLESLKKMILLTCLYLLLIAIILLHYDLSFTSIMTYNLMPPAFGLLVMPYVIRSQMQKKALVEELNAAYQEIERLAKKQERERIARDLHDTLGHTLSLITLKSELVEKLIAKDPERAILESREIRDTARSTLKQVRQLVSDLHLVKLADELVHARSLLSAANIEMVTRVSKLPDSMSYLTENILGMCLRESVTNVVKHSRAKRCEIQLFVDRGEIILKVSDDGVGIADLTKQSGNGLLGMKERLNLVEGKLSIASEKGKGSELTISIPIVIREEKAGESA